MLKLTCATGLLVATAWIGGAPLAAQEMPRAVPKTQPTAWYYYPSRSMRNEEQGVVAFRMVVDEDGRPETCEITEPSAFPDLNDATCAQALRRARFVPGKDEDGSSVKSIYENRTIWVLEVEHVSGPMPSADSFPFATYADGRAQMMVDYRLTIDPSGSAITCAVTSASGAEALEAMACDVIMAIIPETRFNVGFYRPNGEAYMRPFRSSVVWNDPAQIEQPEDPAQE